MRRNLSVSGIRDCLAVVRYMEVLFVAAAAGRSYERGDFQLSGIFPPLRFKKVSVALAIAIHCLYPLQCLSNFRGFHTSPSKVKVLVCLR